jgi:hypothetical protein
MNATRAGVYCLVLSLSAAIPARAAAPLFPKAFHLVREVDDSLTGRVLRVDEYYAGDRAITINGDKTAIADYAKQELTEIDRGKATYSVATFAQIASAQPARRTMAASKDAQQVIERKGSDRRAGRAVDIISADDAGGSLHAEVAVDLSMALSKDAFDVIAGGAFPKSGGAAVDLVRGAAALQRNSRVAADATTSGETYGLPLEQTLRWKAQGESVVVITRVVSIDAQLPPAQLVAIPPGAQRVEAKAVEAKRIADDVDSLVPAARSEH